MPIKKPLIKQYLRYKKLEYPSYEDFVIWADEAKKADMFKDDLGEYKGYINIFSKKWLNNRIAQGGRNSSNLLTLLRSLEEIQDNTDIVEPVKIVMNIPKTNKGTHARTKIKQPNRK